MRNLIILITMLSVLFSCKEAVKNGFTSESVKKEVISAMNRTEWVAISSNAYYSKIVFDNSIIELTVNGGGITRVGFDVGNVTGLLEEIPANIRLVLKSDLPTDVISVSNTYDRVESIVRTDPNVPQAVGYFYRKVE